MDCLGSLYSTLSANNSIRFLALSTFIPQRCYLILSDNQAELFVYRWGRLKEREHFKEPEELAKKFSCLRPSTINILIDSLNQVLTVDILPKASLLDRNLLLKNYLTAKIPVESWYGGTYLNIQDQKKFSEYNIYAAS